MDRIEIEGGTALEGTVSVNGSKNAALPIMTACLLATGPCELERIPKLRDIDTMCRVLESLGVTSYWASDGVVLVDPTELNRHEAPYDLVRTMRASICVLGPLLAKLGKAKVAMPGGCAIGARPIDLHLKGLEQMGAKIKVEGGYVVAECKKLKGARIYLDTPSVGASENLMMAACLADGQTEIENAAREPEIEDLADFLNQLGAEVYGSGTDTIQIQGKSELGTANHPVLPDRIEAATLMMAGAMTSGHIRLQGANPQHLETPIAKLRELGVEINLIADEIEVSSPDRLEPCHVKTLPYPGYPTDVQAQIMALLCTASGTSTITETVFENRFMHVGELRRMGAQIEIEGNTAIIWGKQKLSGAEVMASDLRASAALLLAGLRAEGKTTISRVYHLDRGYQRIEERLADLGAQITRVK
ncbi:UDP-N-acetylglucosamine 1-carboxyvinyltransferase [Candidatus Hydrogenedentota bacterium]